MIILGILGATTLSYHGREVSHEIQRLTWQDRMPGEATAANLRSSIRTFRASFASALGFAAPPAGATFPPERVNVAGHSGYRMLISVTDAEAFGLLATDARLSLEAGGAEAPRGEASQPRKEWGGQPLGEPGARSFAVGLAARLDELQVAVRITRAEAGIWRGTHREITGDLRDLVTERPGNFDAWFLLVNALARAGRVDEAADCCQRAISYAHARGIVDPRHQRLQYDLLNGNLPVTGRP